jgi:streptomycin 6-kinase
MSDAAALTRQLDDLRRRWRGFWPAADADAIAADVAARRDAALTRWGLADARPLPGGHVAAVLAARRGDERVVLKVNPRGHGDDGQLTGEGAALRFWAPTGAVPRLLASGDDGLTLLMDQVRPGVPLDAGALPWEERLSLLARLAARLHAAPGTPPPEAQHLADYARDWRRVLAGGPLAALLEELIVPRPDDVLLHADLHGGNALRGGDGWVVVDPHAVRGDRHADVWALIDPLAPPLPTDPGVAAARAAALVAGYADAAGLDRGRAADWTRLRARAEALQLDAADDASPEDAAWATRLHRFADALS